MGKSATSASPKHRDALVSMITVQGDTEFASVEQQHLLATAPTAMTDTQLLESWRKNNAMDGKWHTY